MRFKNPVIDRIWLGFIALSLLFWLAVLIDRYGVRGVCAGLLVAFILQPAFWD